MPPPPPPPNPRGEEGRAKRKGGERGEEGRGEGKRASACRGEEGGRGTPTPTPPDAGRRGRGAGCRKGRSAARMHVCACVRGTVRKEGCVCVCVRGTVRKEGCVCVCAWGVNDWPGVGWARRRPAPRCWPSTAARRRPCRHRGASYPNPAPPHVQQAPLPPLGSAQRELRRGEGRRRVACGRFLHLLRHTRRRIGLASAVARRRVVAGVDGRGCVVRESSERQVVTV